MLNFSPSRFSSSWSEMDVLRRKRRSKYFRADEKQNWHYSFWRYIRDSVMHVTVQSTLKASSQMHEIVFILVPVSLKMLCMWYRISIYMSWVDHAMFRCSQNMCPQAGWHTICKLIQLLHEKGWQRIWRLFYRIFSNVIKLLLTERCSVVDDVKRDCLQHRTGYIFHFIYLHATFSQI